MGTLRSLRALGMFAGAVGIMASSRWMTSAKPSWRAQFTVAASNLRLTAARLPTADSGLRRDAKVPRPLSQLRISVPQKRDTGQTGTLAFVITSKTGYPRLGIAPGKNYFWRDFVGGQWRLLVIPADTLAPTHWLRLQPHSHLPPQDGLPRLLMLGSTSTYGTQFEIRAESVEGGTCMGCGGMGWCISHDTQPGPRVTALPSDEIAAYFRRHGVRWTLPASTPER